MTVTTLWSNSAQEKTSCGWDFKIAHNHLARGVEYEGGELFDKRYVGQSEEGWKDDTVPNEF
ncbi:hypothetical protein BT69DRAFT_1275677 [Atractiella rhizophila]|nr:hypothetical protein BT69DRAFT_1285080 [Atractiella rhizophila]KAH8930262.1 hypothetical protein BT69DRAFT_1275677 [Atractiella rhizophila]